jgi:hypothetical protein
MKKKIKNWIAKKLGFVEPIYMPIDRPYPIENTQYKVERLRVCFSYKQHEIIRFTPDEMKRMIKQRIYEDFVREFLKGDFIETRIYKDLNGDTKIESEIKIAVK